MSLTSTTDKLLLIESAFNLCMKHLPENAMMPQVRDVIMDAQEATAEMLTERRAAMETIAARIAAARAGHKTPAMPRPIRPRRKRRVVKKAK